METTKEILATRLARKAKRIQKIYKSKDLYLDFLKLEHHDGQIEFTRSNNIAAYSRTKVGSNVSVDYTTFSEIYAQCLHFLNRCLEADLPLVISKKHFVEEDFKRYWGLNAKQA